jgi:hypothetical protein
MAGESQHAGRSTAARHGRSFHQLNVGHDSEGSYSLQLPTWTQNTARNQSRCGAGHAASYQVRHMGDGAVMDRVRFSVPGTLGTEGSTDELEGPICVCIVPIK